MYGIDPIRQLVEQERFRDLKRTLAQQALIVQLPGRERSFFQRAAGALGALLVVVGNRLQNIGGSEATVAYHEIIAQKS